MADTKISALTADTTPTDDDLIPTVNDPSGTPANRKVTLGAAARYTVLHAVADATARDALSGTYAGMRCVTVDNMLRFFHDGTGWHLEGEQCIAAVTLGSNGATLDSGTLPVIPNANELRVEIRCQHATLAGETVLFRVNADSGNNYSRQSMFGFDTTISTSEETGVSNFSLMGASNNSANRWSIATVRIPDYRGSGHKSMLSMNYDPRSLTTMVFAQCGGVWASTAAITSVLATVNSGNLVTGSSIRVYARSTKG